MSTLRDRVQKTVTTCHVATYRVTGGKLGGRFGKAPILVLTTMGRKSGKRRDTPLLYVVDGEDLVVVASNGGDDRPPAWSLNLGANHDAVAQIGKERRPVRAREARAEEHERLWSMATAIYPGYDSYQRRTSRPIPMVILEPTR